LYLTKGTYPAFFMQFALPLAPCPTGAALTATLILPDGTTRTAAATEEADVADFFGTTQTSCLEKGPGFAVWGLLIGDGVLEVHLPGYECGLNPVATMQAQALTGKPLATLRGPILLVHSPVEPRTYRGSSTVGAK
jgi:hypothetical protein